MNISYINGKAHEHYRIELPDNVRTQSAVAGFMKSSHALVNVIEEYENGTPKVIEASIPCSYADGLRAALRSS